MEPTGPNRILKRVSVVATATLAVLGVHTAALAQQGQVPDAPPTAAAAEPAPPATPAPPPPAAAEPVPAPPPPGYGPTPGYGSPPGYGPTPGYGSPPGYGPPPGYGYRPHYGYQPGYYPPPAPVYAGPMRFVYHPFMFSVGLGARSLSFSNSDTSGSEAGLSYALHIGFGITPRWMVLLAADGTWAQFSGAAFSGHVSYAQTTYTAGAQFFILPWLYSRLGLGFGCIEWSDDWGDWSDCRGQAAAGGVGAQFLQTRSTSLAAELAATVARYSDSAVILQGNEVWYSIGVNLMLNLF